MRAQHDDALTAHRHTTIPARGHRPGAPGRHRPAGRRRPPGAGRRALAGAGQPGHPPAIPDVQHQLAVLKALADQLAQKTTSLEQQREAVDRAATQISKLTVMDRELDAWLRRQEEQIRRFGPIEAKIAEVQALAGEGHGPDRGAAGRPSRSRGRRSRRARQALTDLREQMRKSSEGFELENRGLHAVSERVADLRDAVKECEARFAVLDAASQGAAAVQARCEASASRRRALARSWRALPRRRGGSALMRERRGAARDAWPATLAERMRRIEELRPELDEAVRQLATLKGTHEMMADGLEQMRVAYEEMTRRAREPRRRPRPGSPTPTAGPGRSRRR